MTTEQIKYAIENEKLELGFWQTVSHFAGIIFFFSIFPIAFLISLISAIHKGLLLNFDFLIFLLFLLIFSLIGLWFYILLQDSLKFKSASTAFLSENEIYSIVKKIAKELKWSFNEHESQIADVFNPKVIIANTHPSSSLFESSEQITIILDNKRVLVNILYNPSKKLDISSLLKNKKNVNKLIEEIEKTNAKNAALQSN